MGRKSVKLLKTNLFYDHAPRALSRLTLVRDEIFICIFIELFRLENRKTSL